MSRVFDVSVNTREYDTDVVMRWLEILAHILENSGFEFRPGVVYLSFLFLLLAPPPSHEKYLHNVALFSVYFQIHNFPTF